MNKTRFIMCAYILAACSGWAQAAGSAANERDALTAVLQRASERHAIPGLSVAVLTSNGLEQMASCGVRKYKTDIEITDDDLWHLGSNTKMITASLAAICVEKGLIKWTTTVHDVFKDTMDISPEYRDVTISALLSHRGGLPANVDYNRINPAASLREQRLELTRSSLSKPPRIRPESAFLYSNAGYIVVGAMLEACANTDWETLVKEYVFEPLGMTSAGFGGIGTVGRIDQPWGHGSPKKPFPTNGPNADNPPVLGPAGTIHCTMADWSKFIADQLRGSRGMPGLLRAESYQFMQSPHYSDEYGLGWIRADKDWADGFALTHEGSNTLFLSLVWLVPRKDVAVLVCTNEGKTSEKAADEIVAEILTMKGIVK